MSALLRGNAVRPLRREHLGRRALGNDGGERRRLRTRIVAERPDPIEVVARPVDGAALDQSLALAGERVQVVRLELKRLEVEFDRLARQLLALSGAGEADVG